MFSLAGCSCCPVVHVGLTVSGGGGRSPSSFDSTFMEAGGLSLGLRRPTSSGLLSQSSRSTSDHPFGVGMSVYNILQYLQPL